MLETVQRRDQSYPASSQQPHTNASSSVQCARARQTASIHPDLRSPLRLLVRLQWPLLQPGLSSRHLASTGPGQQGDAGRWAWTAVTAELCTRTCGLVASPTSVQPCLKTWTRFDMMVPYKFLRAEAPYGMGYQPLCALPYPMENSARE